jgi:hypothetical protein
MVAIVFGTHSASAELLQSPDTSNEIIYSPPFVGDSAQDDAIKPSDDTT